MIIHVIVKHEYKKSFGILYQREETSTIHDKNASKNVIALRQ